MKSLKIFCCSGEGDYLSVESRYAEGHLRLAVLDKSTDRDDGEKVVYLTPETTDELIDYLLAIRGGPLSKAVLAATTVAKKSKD